MKNGRPDSTPPLGDLINPLERGHIYKANNLMFTTTTVAVLIMSGTRILLKAMLT